MHVLYGLLAGSNSLLIAPILAVLVILTRRFLSPICNIPGPFLASFSTLWLVYELWKGHMENDLVKLHEKHGHFVRISHKEVSVSHPDAIKLLLHAPIPKSKWYSIFSMPDYTYVNQMSECDPKEHIRKGRNVAAGYALSNIIKSEPEVDNLIRLMLGCIDELAKEGRPVEFDKWLIFLAFDVVGEVTFSEPFRFLETGTDIRNAISNTRQLALYIAVMGHHVWLHHATLGSPLMGRLGIQPTSHIFDTCLDAMDRRRRNPDVRQDMLAQWERQRRLFPDRMAESELFAAVVANVGAGGDTSCAAMQSLIYILLRNPRHLATLRAEINAAQRRGELSEVVSYAESQRLPFLQACIKETYRWHPSVPSNLARVVPAGGITIGERYFPEGTLLSVNPWVIHRDTSIFGPDAAIYNPERWLDEDRAKQMSSYLIHWGAGYNQCPGRNLAHFEISKIGAQLIRDYDIELINPEKEWYFQTHFTYVQSQWPCRLKKRAYME